MLRWLTLLLCVFSLAACRGDVSRKPPVHIVPNMDDMEKYDPQEVNPLFADGRAMRKPVAGTIARGELRDNPVLFEGLTPEGKLVAYNPQSIDEDLLLRGQNRFNIFCAPCHDKVGSGNGLITTQYQGLVKPVSFHDDRIRLVEDGYIYRVITYGIRTMPSYRTQIPVEDRWAIVAYVRALQRSQHTMSSDLPEGKREQLREIN